MLKKLHQRAWVTELLIIICVIVFMMTLVLGQMKVTTQVLLNLGALYNVDIFLYHEWWRFITPIFLHSDIEHLAFNMISLYFLGSELEKILGHLRFAGVFFLSAIGGNIVSFALSVESISVGASGGIYGLFAAYIVLSYLFPISEYLKSRAISYSILMLLNMVSVFTDSSIDHLGHFGGLIFGGAWTYIFALPQSMNTSTTKRVVLFVLVVAISGILVYYGINQTYAYIMSILLHK